MAEEVYEGAIGIDLGAYRMLWQFRGYVLSLVTQELHTRVLPIMRAPMSKSVRATNRRFRSWNFVGTDIVGSCQRARKLHHTIFRLFYR